MRKRADRSGEDRLGRPDAGRLARAGAASALLLLSAALLAGCGGKIDPDRPPLPRDYEPPPIDGAPKGGPPSRI